MKTIYLDNAATQPLREVVVDAMKSCLNERQLNPSAQYAETAKAKLEDYRTRVARALQVKSSEIIFTNGATDANNILVSGVMRACKGSELIVGPTEHDSIRLAAEDRGSKTVCLNEGKIDVDDLKKKLNDKVALISIIAVENETGIIHNLKPVRNLIDSVTADRQKRGVDMPLYLHTDAAQALYLNLAGLVQLVDSATLNGSKLGGPSHSGCLILKRNIVISSTRYGGNQERSLRPGTESLLLSLGFVTALEATQVDGEASKVTKLRDFFEQELEDLGAVIVGKKLNRSPHISNVIFSNQDNELLANKLANRGVYVGLGSACHAGSNEPSQVLRAHGFSDDQARSSLRFSYGFNTNKADLVKTLSHLKELL